jgi:hypothetical protein
MHACAQAQGALNSSLLQMSLLSFWAALLRAYRSLEVADMAPSES